MTSDSQEKADKMLSNSGKKLENYIAGVLCELDKYSRPTKGSGAHKEIADILNEFFYIEAKHRGTENITIKRKVWKKLLASLPIGTLKIPVYWLENMHEEKFVVMGAKDFIRLVLLAYPK